MKTKVAVDLGCNKRLMGDNMDAKQVSDHITIIMMWQNPRRYYGVDVSVICSGASTLYQNDFLTHHLGVKPGGCITNWTLWRFLVKLMLQLVPSLKYPET